MTRGRPNGVAPAVTGLLSRLKTYAVDWKFSFVPTENVEYEPGIDREEAELSKANVVSSERKGYPMDPVYEDEETVLFGDVRGRKQAVDEEGNPLYRNRHAILLDIDYPAYLLESSTPGHYHLYLDVPGGVKHEDYMELLALLGRIGAIEKGYAEVSIKRGHSDLRLPWVRKEDQVKHEPGPGVDLAPTEREQALTDLTPVEGYDPFDF